MRKFCVPVLMGLALSTTGCEQTRQALGLKRTQVDEFQVDNRQPLSTPLNYKLRPPMPNAPAAAEVKPADKAKEALLGDQAFLGEGSAVEKSMLLQASAQKNEPTIRDQLSQDNASLKNDEKGFGESLAFWTDKASQKSGDIINPVAENKRHNG